MNITIFLKFLVLSSVSVWFGLNQIFYLRLVRTESNGIFFKKSNQTDNLIRFGRLIRPCRSLLTRVLLVGLAGDKTLALYHGSVYYELDFKI